MKTLDKNTKKLSRLKAQLLDSPDANPSVQTRLLNCIEDATDETQKEKALGQYYTYARSQATRFGYAEYLTQGTLPTENPVLEEAFRLIETHVALVVPSNADHPIYTVLRRKKNSEGIIRYTPQTLRRYLANQSKRWHSLAFKNKTWDGSITSMILIGELTEQEDA